MNEQSDKHEKLKSNDDDDDVTTTDSNKLANDSERSNKRDSESDIDNSKSPKPKSEGLASFFKTKAERQKEVIRDHSPVESVQNSAQELPSNSENFQDNIDEEQNAYLTNEEVQEVTIAIVDARTQEVGEELNIVEPDSVDEFEALADAVFLESLQDLASGDDEVTQDTIDAAFDEALEDLSLDKDMPEDTESGEPLAAVQTIAKDDTDPNTPRTLSVPPVIPPIVPPAPPSGPNVATNQSLPLSGGGHNYSPTPYDPNFTFNPNASSSPDIAPVMVQEIHNHHSDLLLGVIVGYIIGRRGGRKRTEKKLIPKIDKLEEQVKTLHDTIIEKEVLIRRIARENAESLKRVPGSTVGVLERLQTKKQVKEALKRREILAKDPGVEKIGKFSLPALKVFHERRLPDGTENSPSRKRVEVMTTTELLEKVESLVIHDLKVTEMFHKSRLTDESLRQITKEYLRGGPYEQTFFRELLPDPTHIENLKNQVIEKNTANEVDETIRNQFALAPSQKTRNIFPDNRHKPKGIFKSLKKQNRPVVSGVISAIVLSAILTVILLLR